MKPKHAATAAIAGVAGIAIVGLSLHVFAADHDEMATTALMDPPADIGDVYAFHDDSHLTFVMTFDGYKVGGVSEPEYDPDLLFSFEIDTVDDAEAVADQTIHVRFGQASDESWGVQVQGVPGVDEAIVGPIDTVIEHEESGARVFAGFRDDPYFFDRQGYLDTLATDTLSFDPNRDFVANQNTGAIVIEFDHTVLPGRVVRVWATSGRAS